MRLRTQTYCAIEILIYLAEKGETVPSREIASVLHENDSYIPKVARRLRDKGWISADSGTTGGYTMAKKPQEISILDVMTVFGDVPRFGQNANEDRTIRSEMAQKLYSNYQKMAEDYFSSITLAEMLMEKRI